MAHYREGYQYSDYSEEEHERARERIDKKFEMKEGSILSEHEYGELNEQCNSQIISYDEVKKLARKHGIKDPDGKPLYE